MQGTIYLPPITKCQNTLLLTNISKFVVWLWETIVTWHWSVNTYRVLPQCEVFTQEAQEDMNLLMDSAFKYGLPGLL